MNFYLKRSNLAYLIAIIFCTLLLLSPYICDSLILPRTEELPYSLYPLIVWSRQLMEGSVPLWFADGALGIPWPVPHTMSHTPLVAFFAVLPVYKALSCLLACHISIQAFFIIKINHYFRFAPITSIIVLISVLLASPMEYLVSSDAAAVYLAWTLLPGILYSLLKILEPAPASQTLRYSVLLATFVGYGILNCHTGVFSTHVMGLSLIAILQPKALVRRWRFLIFSAFLSLFIGSEKIYLLYNDLSYFKKDLLRYQYTFGQEPYYVFWNLFIKPFVIRLNTLDEGYKNFFLMQNSMSRTLTFGSPLCSILLCCGFLRFLKGGHSLLANRFLEQAMWGMLAVCFFIQFVPTKFLPILISASWTFRDPAILIALILSGLLCDNWLRRLLNSFVINNFLGIHSVLLLVCAAIFSYGPNWYKPTGISGSKLYNEIVVNGKYFPLQKMILDNIDCKDDLDHFNFLSKRVVCDGCAAYAAHSGSAVNSGLHLNVLPLTGLQDVSYLTKGLSMDAIHPSQRIPYGMISTLRFSGFRYHSSAFDWVQDSPALLDLLGIRMVIGIDDPLYLSHGLERIGVINPQESRTKNTLSVYKNPRAFPRAFFVSHEWLDKVQRDIRCPENADFLTCMDVSPITENTDPWKNPVRIQDRVNGMRLFFEPCNTPRTMLITSMFRPEWKAQGCELLSFKGLMLLEVPPQVTTVNLDYFPSRLIAARAVSLICSGLTFIVLIISFFFLGKSQCFRKCQVQY